MKKTILAKTSPEIFVGRFNYPNVNFGLLASSEEKPVLLPTAKQWSANNLKIPEIVGLRSKLLFSHSKTHIKSPDKTTKKLQEIALSIKPLSTEIYLKNSPTISKEFSHFTRPIISRAKLQKIILNEQPKTKNKIEKIVYDTDIKAVEAVKELSLSRIPVEKIQTLISIGLLGRKTNRKLVPTRWSITAIDDTVSKQHLEKIRFYPQINTIQLFQGSYLGNQIFALLIPAPFSFEAIEIWVKGSRESREKDVIIADYEGFTGRKKYAENLQGGYYALRLPLTEYLMKIKKQAKALIIRQVTKEYTTPLGVGIVRESARRAFQQKPLEFETIPQALNKISQTCILNPEQIKQKSKLLRENQKTIFDFK